MKNAWQNQHKLNLLHNARKNVKIGFLNHSLRVIASLIFNKLLEASTLSCQEGTAVVRMLGFCFLPFAIVWGFSRFLKESSSRAVARRGSAD